MLNFQILFKSIFVIYISIFIFKKMYSMIDMIDTHIDMYKRLNDRQIYAQIMLNSITDDMRIFCFEIRYNRIEKHLLIKINLIILHHTQYMTAVAPI